MDWVAIVATTNTALVTCGGVIWAFNRTTISSAVATSNEDLLKLINGTYIRSAGSHITGDEIERRLTSIDKKFEKIYSKLDDITYMLARTLPAHERRSLTDDAQP